jgi:hypothetical protein
MNAILDYERRGCAAPFVEADEPQAWPPELAPFVTFLELGGEALPTSPFHLRPGEFVREPAAWLAMLRADVARGPAGPRARYDSLQADLRRLHELFAATPRVRSRPAKPR